ncbi:oxidoreductase [Enterovibrio norvegicus]|uniref:Predicted dehydrogenase n=1 Tax=Enterovibrio norvegicus DSM 15893 TaxID=1121869 RepID=A0A1I5XDL9_9GAMM|nr:Gfo/Idh/MocA family oxidoreductase [Enterovibrio norvegicus]OEF49796.1 oxidoreductase [Enterovibrio norvegicus]SFQ29974.1 Predicted dehydrogenase [Enterovibrio norvegicus DSM 15893]
MEMLRIAVVGAGLIGKNHIRLVDAHPNCQLAAIVDPFEASKQLAAEYNAPHFADLEAMIEAIDVDGVILATPNNLHVTQAKMCIQHAIPVLIEKPVSHTVEEATELLNIAVNTPGIWDTLLVGHHRMHSPIIKRTREIIDSGVLGALVASQGSAVFYKPDDYFDAAPWRTKEGGGPILINLIHDIGNLRYLCGEIVAVQAMASSRRRGFDVEDTVSITFNFENGSLGTFLLSDTAGSGRSWEQTSQENKAYSSYEDEDCYHIAGTHGSISVPTMRLKYYKEKEDRSWWKPFECDNVSLERKDPLVEQLTHFCRVIRKEEKPLVTVRDGLQNLRVTEAVVEAVKNGRTVFVNDIG